MRRHCRERDHFLILCECTRDSGQTGLGDLYWWVRLNGVGEYFVRDYHKKLEDMDSFMAPPCRNGYRRLF